MDLPVRIVGAAPDEPVVAVDGALGAAGIELSHWPGNATPADLRHDLSTGSALRFAELSADERARRAAGAVAIVNNHYDTDGVCALFAVRRPAEALARRERLLAVAATGDLYVVPDEEALAVDALVEGLADPARSPLAAELEGLDDRARHERCVHHLVERLDAILDGDLAPYRALWEPALAELRADLADLARAARTDHADADLAVWVRRGPLSPGRHALLGRVPGRDRVLALGRAEGGTTARLVVSTRSWFDLERPGPPRPDLAGLAARLNAREGTDPEGPLAWRAQASTNASPELWFGRAELAAFAERNAALAPSALAAAEVVEEVRAALAPARPGSGG